MATSSARREALARLAELGARPDVEATDDAVEVADNGTRVYAGGDVARLLLSPAHLVYVEDKVKRHVFPAVGDVILVDQAQADRLDGLGVTCPLEEAPEVIDKGDGEVTDEDLAHSSAEDLIAYVTQNPEERARVRAIEVATRGEKARKTVIDATEDPDNPDDATSDDEELD